MINTKSLNVLTKQLIKKHSSAKAPIDIFGIIENIGINLKFEEMEDEMSGFINISEDRSIIVINDKHHMNRKRFSAAHELGHYCLHKDVQSTFIDKSFITGLSVKKGSTRGKTFHRNSLSSKGEHLHEIEANRFAATILMPEDLIEDTILELNIDLTIERDLERLAIKFGVSVQAMAFRLASLGVSYF